MGEYAYRMSEAGDCARSLSAGRLGYEPIPHPGWLITMGNEGKRHQEWVIEDLRNEGYEVETAEVCQECLKEFGSSREGVHVELVYPLFRFVGHLDGRLPGDSRSRPLEIKSLGRFRFQKFMTRGFPAFPDFAGQETCYMTAVGKENWPGFYIVKNRDTGRKEPFDVHEPPSSMEEIIDKLNLVEALARKEELAEAAELCSEDDMRFCQFRYLCSTPVKIITTEITQEVADAFKLWKDGYLIAKQVESARDTIKDFMVKSGLTRQEVHDVLATVTPGEKETYSKANLLKFIPDETLAKCKKVTASYRLDMKNLSVIEEE